jgi:hypothetical protein
VDSFHSYPVNTSEYWMNCIHSGLVPLKVYEWKFPVISKVIEHVSVQQDGLQVIRISKITKKTHWAVGVLYTGCFMI